MTDDVKKASRSDEIAARALLVDKLVEETDGRRLDEREQRIVWAVITVMAADGGKMSVLIGKYPMEGTRPPVTVSASTGGVEVYADPRCSLQPTEARAFAYAVIAASEEVERMRANTARDCARNGPSGT